MVNNGSLYNNVMEKLKFESGLDDSNITISIKGDNVVVLGGKVRSYAEKRLAEEAVESVDKVKGIADELSVELDIGYRRSDAEIAKAALDVLKWCFFVPHEKIKVIVENGHLTLTGTVDFYYQKERAKKAVQDLYGVTFVTNNIDVKRTFTKQEVKNQIVKEFERNARIDANNVRVEVEDSKVILRGKVKNLDEVKEARKAAWSVPGVSNVIDELTIGW
jgi:osmotically-inducible protein OsmY